MPVQAAVSGQTLGDLRTRVQLLPGHDGSTVGVGLPIRVYFHRAVTDKAAVERNLKVTTSTPTDGVWHWMSNTEVHFRPSTYWPANSDVRVDANLYGVDFGNGVWGHDHLASIPAAPDKAGGEFNVDWLPVAVMFNTPEAVTHITTLSQLNDARAHGLITEIPLTGAIFHGSTVSANVYARGTPVVPAPPVP